MNPEVKEQWLAALRSGEYVQGKNYLAAPDINAPGEHVFCCLGVLTQLAVDEGVVDWDEEVDENEEFSINNNTGNLDKQVMEWAGIDSATGYCPGGGDLSSLVRCNDNLNYDFDEIADTIEKYF